MKEGVEFFGFRHLPHMTKLRKENVRRLKARMRRLQEEYSKGEVLLSEIGASVTSWLSHLCRQLQTSSANASFICIRDWGGRAINVSRFSRRELEQQPEQFARLEPEQSEA